MADAIRHRGPRWRPGRLRHRAVRRGGRPEHRRWSRSAGRRHVPPPGLHPGQGAAPDGRGAAHRPRRREFGVDSAASRPRPRPRRQARKQEVVDRLTKGLEAAQGAQVTMSTVAAKSSTRAGHGSCVDDGTEVAGDARSSSPPARTPRSLPGLDFDGTRVLSSDHVLAAQELPPRALVIGGGVIGCEFASMLADMGSEVTVLEVLPRILPGADEEVAESSPACSSSAASTCTPTAALTGIDGADELTVAFEGPIGRAVGHRRQGHRDHRPRRRAPRGIGLEAAGVEHRAVGLRRGRRRRCARTSPASSPSATSSTRRSSRTWASPRRSSRSRRSSASPPPGRLRQGAVGHLLPPRGRVVRAHRGAGRRSAGTTS